MTSDLQSSSAIPSPRFLALARIGPYFRDWRVPSICAFSVQFILSGLSVGFFPVDALTMTCCNLRQSLSLVVLFVLAVCMMCLPYLVGRFTIFRSWMAFLSMVVGWFIAQSMVSVYMHSLTTYVTALRSSFGYSISGMGGAVLQIVVTGFCFSIVQFLVGRRRRAEGLIRYLRRELPPTTFSKLISNLQPEEAKAGIPVPSDRYSPRARSMSWGAWITCWTVALLLIAAFLVAYGAIPTGPIHVTNMSDSGLVILKPNRILFTQWIILTWLVIAFLPRIMLSAGGAWISVSSSEAVSHRYFGTLRVALWAMPGLLLSGFAVAAVIERALWRLHVESGLQQELGSTSGPISLLTILDREHIGAFLIDGLQGSAALLCFVAAMIAAFLRSKYFMLWLQGGLLAIIAAESAVDFLVYLNDNREYPRWVGDPPALIVFSSILLLLYGLLAARSRRIAVTLFHQVRPDDPLLPTASGGAKRRLHDFQLAQLFAELPASSQQMFFDSACEELRAL